MHSAHGMLVFWSSASAARTFGPALRCRHAIERVEEHAERYIPWRDDVLAVDPDDDLDLFG